MLMSLVFVASKGKKIDENIGEKKLTKIVKVEEVKIHLFWETWWETMKFPGKMQLMVILKGIKK